MRSMAATAEATKRLTKQDLVDYLASGCSPESDWKCAFPRNVGVILLPSLAALHLRRPPLMCRP